MVKKHIKRISAPKSWPILKKENTFITRPLPGGHPFKEGISLNTVMKDMIKLAKTSAEVKKIINTKEVIVDGKRRKEPKHLIGLMDVLSIPEIKKSWIMILTEKGKLAMKELKEAEAKTKLCKILNKSKVKGKIQLNLHDGRNILIDKDEYKTHDTIQISIPEQKITNHLKMEKGMTAIMTSGKRVGSICKIEDIKGNKVIIKKGDDTSETLKKFAFIIGKEKPIISIE